MYEILLEYSVLSQKIHINICNQNAKILYSRTHWINDSVDIKFWFHIENTIAAQQKSTTICEKLREESIEIYLDFESIKILLWVNLYTEYLIA